MSSTYQHVGKTYVGPDGTYQTFMTVHLQFKKKNLLERLWFALMYVLFPHRDDNAARMTVILVGEGQPPDTYQTDAEDNFVR